MLGLKACFPDGTSEILWENGYDSKDGESESEMEVNERVIYDPTAFIRCHGTGRSNRTFVETKTQVWDIAFEPDTIDPRKTTNIVATCGGNSICLIDINTGEVIMKYSHKEKGENSITSGIQSRVTIHISRLLSLIGRQQTNRRHAQCSV